MGRISRSHSVTNNGSPFPVLSENTSVSQKRMKFVQEPGDDHNSFVVCLSSWKDPSNHEEKGVALPSTASTCDTLTLADRSCVCA